MSDNSALGELRELDETWLTVGYERTVLLVVRTVTTLTRLLDVATLTGADHRVQTVLTYDPDRPGMLAAGVPQVLARLETPVIPWRQARRRRFDLAVAASENDRLHQLAAPVLLMPHGVGNQKYYPDSRVVAGLNPRRLRRYGRVVPTAVAVAHPRHQQQLREICPPAAARAVVVGDPSLDRMLASQHREPRLRAALGARGRRLVVVASTWGRGSLLGRCPELPERLVAQLPADEYQLAVVLHPGVWAAHGPWQVRAWLSEVERYGVPVLTPHEGWQAALTAASCVISDQGSLSLYAAALAKPLLLAPGDPPTTVPGSALATLAAGSVRIDPDADLHAQVATAIAGYTPGGHDATLAAAFSAPGQCAVRLRPLLYRLMDLPEPPWQAQFAPVPPPRLAPARPPALLAGAQVRPDEVSVVRFPDLRYETPRPELSYRHLVADAGAATVGQLSGATVLCADPDAWPHPDWVSAADALLARWPQAELVATALPEAACAIRTRRLAATLRVVGSTGAPVDPLLLASLAYVRLQGGPLPERDRLRVGDRVMPVLVTAHRAW